MILPKKTKVSETNADKYLRWQKLAHNGGQHRNS